MTQRLLLYISFILGFLIGGVGNANAQISVSAPSKVSAGENFRIAYTINTQDVDDFRAGNIPSGLELIAGPYTSQQSSYQMINGHTSSSSSITFTFTVFAARNGVYTIPAAPRACKGPQRGFKASAHCRQRTCQEQWRRSADASRWWRPTAKDGAGRLGNHGQGPVYQGDSQ